MITQTEIQSNRTIIDTAKRRIIERHPEMSKMAEAAAYYVNRDGGITVVAYNVIDVRNRLGVTHRLTYGAAGWECTCPAWRHTPYIIHDHRYCTHIVALSIHSKLINGGN